MDPVESILERNKRVEADKAWETSKTRRALIAVLTYIVASLYMMSLGASQPFLNALIPTFGYLFSTLSLPVVRRVWLKSYNGKTFQEITGDKMNKNFFIMRHGETVANLEGYAAGSLDTPLTENGKAQAIEVERDVFDFLGGQIDYIVHSSLSRARDTARIVNERLSLPSYETDLLKEQCFGDWRGMKWEEMRNLLDQGINPPKGESRSEFYERALQGIVYACDASAGTPLIVTHGGIFDALFDYLNISNVDVKNCALYEYDPHHHMRFFSFSESGRVKSA